MIYYHPINKYTFLTKWGSFGRGDGEFQDPHGVAIDSSGNVYVTDSKNNRVQKFTSSGTFLTKWGSKGRVQKFTSSGTFLTKWGSFGRGDGEFRRPHRVAVDSSGHVFVCDLFFNHIQKFTNDGKFIRQWGGMFGDINPIALAVDYSGYVYVCDLESEWQTKSSNYCIQKFTNDGQFITKWGSKGDGNGQFKNPSGIAVDSSGKVYVSDRVKNIIQVFSPLYT